MAAGRSVDRSSVAGADNPRTKQEPIINACLSRDKAASTEDYKRQQVGLRKVLAAVENKEPLSVKFIKELHALLSPPITIKQCLPPEVIAMLNNPGKFRNTLVGTTPSEALTEEGVSEILDIIDEESKGEFLPYKGTWIGPLDDELETASLPDSIHHANLANKVAEAKGSKTELAKKIYADTKRRPHILVFPRNNNTSVTIQDYMERKMQELVEKFNKDIHAVTSPGEQKRLIVIFIKRCVRLHPFRDLNHRTFALGVLNFLLLSNNIGYCPLKNRRIFSTIGLSETLKIIDSALILFNSRSAIVVPSSSSDVLVHRTLRHPTSTRPPAASTLSNKSKVGIGLVGGGLGYWGGSTYAAATMATTVSGAAATTVCGMSSVVFVGMFAAIAGAIFLLLLAYAINRFSPCFFSPTYKECRGSNLDITLSPQTL